MTDSIEDDDVRRVDSNVDPTALTPDDVASELPDDFSREAKRAFGERVAEQRDPVRDSVDLSNRISRNPASGEAQVRGPDGRLGPKASSVRSTRLEDNGDYVAELDPDSSYAQDHGTTSFRIDRVDLDAGADDHRSDNW